MRNNEYTATPNWFKQEPTDSQANIYLTNYYIGGSSTSGSSVLSSISLYNKYIINTYTLTVDDLIIPNTAIIAVDSELPEGQERPEEFVSEIGNLVSAENWYTSYSIRVLSGTTIKANLKANTSRYGIVFYDKHNTPISGYTPSEDKLVEILVPDSANYFRCCHYIDSNAGSDSFYIEYQSVDKYNDDLLNEAYSGTFEDFTSIDNDIQEGIIKDTINNTLLKLIFQQPLQFTTDKAGNIKVELNNDVLKDSLLSDNYVTTIENNPQDILSLKDFKQGLKINGIEIVEKNGFILIKGNLATTGGITAYTEDPDDPGSGGNPSGGGTIDSISISGTGNAFTSAELSTDKKSIIFIKGETFATQNWITNQNYITSSLLNNYVTLNTDQEISGIKDFINGIKLNNQLIKIENGILYLDCSVAVTGGLTVYAKGEQTIPDIWEGAPFDNVTIHYNPTTKIIEVLGATGSNFDEGAMWTALSSSDSSKLINASHLSNALSGYATQSWVQSLEYATQSALNSVSNKLNDFLEGSDTDTIINKWKELEAFLSGMTESDNLAEILSTKADKSFVTSELTKYVTLATEQDITAIKHFTQGLSVGTSKHKIYEKDGAVILEGNLLVTGGVTAYSDGSSSGGSSGGIDVDSLWAILGGTGTQQINKSHLTDALNGYATESWVTSKNYATKSTTLAGYGITDAYTKTEANNAFVNVSGDTMTGNLQINSSNSSNGMLKLNSVTEESSLSFFKNGTPYITFGITSYANDSYNSNYLGFYDNANIYGGGNKWYKVWHAGNDGSGSGLDADTLDTKHYYDFLYNFGYDITSASNIRDIPHGTFFSSNSAQNGPVQYIWFNGIVFASNNNSNYKKIFGVDDSGVFWVANEYNGTWNDWKRVAYTTDTVASALKLTTDAGSNVNPVYFANGVPVRCAYNFGNGSGNAAVSNGILCTNLNADTLDGVHNGFVSGNLQSYTLPYTNTDKVGWWVKIASMSLNSRYTSKEAVLLISKMYTITGDSQYAFIFARIQQQNDMGDIPNTELSSFGSIDNSNIVGILNYNGSVSTLDIYFREVERYQRGLVSLVQGDEIRTNSQDFVQSLPAGIQIVSVNSFISGHSKRLLTARTLWGRPFDGTANVDGDIVNTQTIKSKDGYYLDLNGNIGIAFYTASGVKGVINSSGNFGIGTTSPIFNLQVAGVTYSDRFVTGFDSGQVNSFNCSNWFRSSGNTGWYNQTYGGGIYMSDGTWVRVYNNKSFQCNGNILATGGVTCYSSDARAKTIVEELKLSLKQISESPIIRFKWNGWNIPDDGKTHIGGIAQYVQKLLPECILDADGVLNMDYATTAYVYSVLTARHLQTYETKTDKEIRNLKNRIKLLEKLLKKLSYEEIDTMVN